MEYFKGQEFEDKAIEYLKKKKYKILNRNYRTRLGEIDIIVIKDKNLVFIEVKGGKEFPPPYLRITPQKIRKIHITINSFLRENPELEYETARIDVISVTLPDYKIDHFEDITAH